MEALLSSILVNPVSLFGTSDTGGIRDPSNLASLFQNSNGTGAVTTTGDPVGRASDVSGKGMHLTQATGAARMTYNSANGGFLESDGAATFLGGTNTYSAARTLVVAFQSMESGSGRKRLFGFDALNAFNDTNDVAQWYGQGAGGTVIGLARTPRSIPNVLAVRRLSDSSEEIWWNGQLLTTVTPNATSSPATYAWGADSGFGTNKGAARIWWDMTISRALTTPELLATMQYAANKIRSAQFGPCDIFGVLGQSNTYFGATLDPAIDVGGSSIYEFAQNGQILLAVDPLDTFVGRSPGVIGNVMAFARQYVAAGKLTAGNKVLIVHCGYGGTGFSSAAPNTWSVATGSLRARSISRLNAALTAAPGSTVKGVIWSQGETDVTAGGSWPADYQSLLGALIQDVRSQVSGAAAAPFLVTQMPPTFVAANGANGATIQAALTNAPGNYSRCACALSTSLTVYDGLHFDAASQRILGARVFDAYDTLD